MTTLAERIAAEVMNTIEREQRVSKDDITEAASKVLGQHYMQKIAEANTRLRETMEAIRPLSGRQLIADEQERQRSAREYNKWRSEWLNDPSNSDSKPTPWPE